MPRLLQSEKDDKPYRKPEKLVETLMKLFDGNDKLKPSEMRDKMSKMIDPDDGGLMFCPSKALTNGLLLNEDIILQFITKASQERKNNNSYDN